MTVGVPSAYGIAWTLVERIERPRNIAPSVVPMMTSVGPRVLHSGFLNAVTPLEIASTPVTAAPPDAKA